jgi:hypothetical protein
MRSTHHSGGSDDSRRPRTIGARRRFSYQVLATAGWHAGRNFDADREADASGRPLPAQRCASTFPEERAVIARHRPKSVFKPADVERVRERFQTILKIASEKPLNEVKPPMASPARTAPVPAPTVRRRKRA